MKIHQFINSNPAGFDSNCATCGGKHRDAIHAWRLSRYAHGGEESTLLPSQEADRRELAIADGLRKLAKACGITLREPLRIDSNGEFAIVVSNGTDRDGPQDPCGQWGPEFVAHLNASGGGRCGINPTSYHAPENGWSRLNHFAAQAMLERAENFDPR